MRSKRIFSSLILSLPLLLLLGCAAETPEPEPSAGPGAGSQEGFEVLSPEVAEAVAELRERALGESHAYELLRDLTAEVGHRFAGSGNDVAAARWMAERMRAMGLDDIRLEPVTVPRWIRGEAAGRITVPAEEDVVLIALGGSVGTPEGGIEAPVLRVGSLAELRALAAGAAEGKIVFIDHRMQWGNPAAGYGTVVAGRVDGPSAAAEKGALALLIRSVGISTDRVAHTGTLRYAEELPRIPAAALSNVDADALAGLLAEGGEVRFRLELGSRDAGEAESFNVVAEIRGRETPEEVVLMAAHLDSWDLGTGAVDDGLGVAVVTDALAHLAAMPERPRRTVRVFLAANEEFGLSGARAYAEAYAEALADHVAAAESDFGTGRVVAFRSRVGEAALPAVHDLARLLEPLGIEYQPERPAFGGADLSPMAAARIPIFDLGLYADDYFEIHHTVADTMERIDPEALPQIAAAYATWAWALAEMDFDLGRAPARE